MRDKVRTPEQTAEFMRKQYGANASAHATYTLMQYDHGTPGYVYWMEVLNCLTAYAVKKPHKTSQNT